MFLLYGSSFYVYKTDNEQYPVSEFVKEGSGLLLNKRETTHITEAPSYEREKEKECVVVCLQYLVGDPSNTQCTYSDRMLGHPISPSI